MIEEWVPAHKRLMKGPKRHLRRGVRFVLLELSMEARGKGGVLDLPLAWTTERAIHDLIGGDRKEIAQALAAFTQPDEDGVPPIKIERDSTKHRLLIPKWALWAGPKSSTERVRALRERHKNGQLQDGVTLHALHGETSETPYSTGEDSREEKSTEDPPLPPEGERALRTDAPPAPIVHGDRHSTYDLAWGMWRELYQQSRRGYGRYLEDFIKDDKVIQRMAHKADGLTGEDREATTLLLRHWFTSYLRDDGDLNCHSKARHPLRLIERRLVTYGEPKKPASVTRLAKAKPAEPEMSDAELRAAAQQNLGNVERLHAMAAEIAAKRGRRL